MIFFRGDVTDPLDTAGIHNPFQKDLLAVPTNIAIIKSWRTSSCTEHHSKPMSYRCFSFQLQLCHRVWVPAVQFPPSARQLFVWTNSKCLIDSGPQKHLVYNWRPRWMKLVKSLKLSVMSNCSVFWCWKDYNDGVIKCWEYFSDIAKYQKTFDNFVYLMILSICFNLISPLLI